MIYRSIIILLLTQHLQSCEEGSSSLRSGTRPTDDQEGLPGYLEESEEIIEIGVETVVTIANTRVVVPAGAFSQSIKIKLKTLDAENYEAVTSIGSPLGDVVQVDLEDPTTGLPLDSSAILQPFVVYQKIQAPKNDQDLKYAFITKPGTAEEETQALPRSAVFDEESLPELSLADDNKVVSVKVTINSGILWAFETNELPASIKISTSGVANDSASNSTTAAETIAPLLHFAYEIKKNSLEVGTYYGVFKDGVWGDFEKATTIISGGSNTSANSFIVSYAKFSLDSSKRPQFYYPSIDSGVNHLYFDQVWEGEALYQGRPSLGSAKTASVDANGNIVRLYYTNAEGYDVDLWEYSFDYDIDSYQAIDSSRVRTWAPDGSGGGGEVGTAYWGDIQYQVSPTGRRHFLYGAGGSIDYLSMRLGSAERGAWPNSVAASNANNTANQSCSIYNFKIPHLIADRNDHIHAVYLCQDLNNEFRLYYLSDRTGSMIHTFLYKIATTAQVAIKWINFAKLILDKNDNPIVAFPLWGDEFKYNGYLQHISYNTDSLRVMKFKDGSFVTEDISGLGASNNTSITDAAMAVDAQNDLHIVITKNVYFTVDSADKTKTEFVYANNVKGAFELSTIDSAVFPANDPSGEHLNSIGLIEASHY